MQKKDMKELLLISFTPGTNHCASIAARLFVLLVVVVIFAPASLTHAQYCNPATVSYIVRDENGKVLCEAALNSVSEQLPELIGDARVYVGETSFADSGKTFYWSETVDWAKGDKIPALQFINVETCTMHLAEATLTYHDKKMRLLFNLEIARAQPDRRPVIDSLPFQEGTFALDLNGWSHDPDKVISPESWKRVKD
jgi:hypothetical protein